MGRTVIVSEETLRSLVEANASLSAWYHEFVRASREQTPVSTPSDETRNAFLRRIGAELPELAQVVAGVGSCRVYVPPPLAFAPRAPIPTMLDTSEIHPSPEPPAEPPRPEPAVDRPPLVNPRQVKY